MPRTRFDQACRFAAKMDAAGFLGWLLGIPVGFQRWLDTRTMPFPGDPDRTCDTVAGIESAGGAAWAVPIEFCLEPDEEMFGRLLEYLGRLWREKHPDGAGQRYAVGAIVLNLTGQGESSRDMQLMGTGLRTCLGVKELNLASENAATTLGLIAAGTVARCVLPWIALMQGGDDPGIIERWKELAATEPDVSCLPAYAYLAAVFSDAAGRRQIWQVALEGWNMRDSQVALEIFGEGEEKGKLKGRVASLTRLLRRKFPPGPPADLLAMIESCPDANLLDHWLDAAVDAKTLDEFRRAITA